MNPDLWLALQITLIGMSVVFGCILLLWLMMTLLVRWTSKGQRIVTEGDLQLTENAAPPWLQSPMLWHTSQVANRNRFLCPQKPSSAPGRPSRAPII